MSDPRRGFLPADEKEFNEESILLLRRAQQDILYLMERGYPIKNASTFVGNHYMLSERQRLAIVRATSDGETIRVRSRKQLMREHLGKKVAIDGLNIIITLEVALSEGTLLRCMDHTIRDLAGLRGTYRLIERTDTAIRLMGEHLAGLGIQEAVFYLDSPVSNTGRLKTRLFELLSGYSYTVKVELVNNADVLLEKSENVITSDAIILNQCSSWYNLVSEIINEKYPELVIINLENPSR